MGFPPRRFYIHPAFEPVLSRHDIGAGDRFYDDSRAYDLPWGDALKHIARTLVVLQATQGSTGLVRFQISEWDGEQWTYLPDQVLNQTEFAEMLRGYE